MYLKDVVVDRPRILLVGINPGLRSGAVGHHFAGPGNPFWKLLFAAGLIPEPLTHEKDQRLAEFGLALTNLCPRPTRAASDLKPAELARGRKVLLEKIAAMQPSVVAFVGLTLYQRVFGLKSAGGAGAKPETLSGARVFVVPNPSGLNASFPGFKHKLLWFEELRAFADEIAAGNRA